MSSLPVDVDADRITFRHLAARSDAASSGWFIAAGRMLEWIDRAGYACAVGWSGTYCVTAYVGNVHFTRPVRPGDLVETRARVIYTGRTSIHVLVSVATADVAVQLFTTAAHCILVFVALDEGGAPVEVRPWTPRSIYDSLLRSHAEERIRPRDAIRAATDAQEYTAAGSTPRSHLRFIAAQGDANWRGNSHGGTVMRWIDEAAFACAASWSSADAVAVYSGGIQFFRPIPIGRIVEVESRLIHVGARSMHIATQVRSAPIDRPNDRELTTRCISIYVAPGDDGRAAKLRPLPLNNDEDVALDRHAIELMKMRSFMPAIPVDVFDLN
ncbi:Acyl-CoA hydrolase [Microbacterium esteraromaticum]|uniref:Acyl-CoA hydrolase n=1 Tax=Microbacterium esteraromaticum TaxID=57043 RepID=A0A1R4KCI8_9MICO|nr:acyl-CoA thioesterase [Microbacterium esteraromaticum]SJN41733.1 Acyl-CoA hydrolase [Microbacterium esteraromaticum]